MTYLIRSTCRAEWSLIIRRRKRTLWIMTIRQIMAGPRVFVGDPLQKWRSYQIRKWMQGTRLYNPTDTAPRLFWQSRNQRERRVRALLAFAQDIFPKSHRSNFGDRVTNQALSSEENRWHHDLCETWFIWSDLHSILQHTPAQSHAAQQDDLCGITYVEHDRQRWVI
jgi:hypothetical protein